MPSSATLSLADAAAHPWDAVAVGAGPAGALAARALALRGVRVLLVDKSRFPRPKVCGCCLNPPALATLENAGLGTLIERHGARAVVCARFAALKRQADVPVAGRALSRQVFDAALVDAAVEAGVHFLPETSAQLEDGDASSRSLAVQHRGTHARIAARVVLGATGLGTRLLAHTPGVRNYVAADSRLGAGVAVDLPAGDYEDGVIFMAWGHGGYVGLVRLEDGRLNLATALDSAVVKNAGGPGRAVANILEQAGLPSIPDLHARAWHGTPLLTRRSYPPAAGRVFLLGDAAGYIEPFTGEGMAWALASAAAVAPLVVDFLAGRPSPYVQRWSSLHRHMIQRRQWVCHMASAILRSPPLVHIIMPALVRFPALMSPWVRYVHGISPTLQKSLAFRKNRVQSLPTGLH